ncbi:tripartite tricarboxylate transporter TctB family protein [Atlantibacter subterraneus]|uniref:Tripartite tricarboxylate transporter TctB family protein n=1 Tax=Atlantibacter subterraneus TaxID=255519 RepID=A0A427UQT3_9ENTR|nr:tripartite tricarboxylate transporter TctB family protein [Atlantibacter subterranea]QFH68327.1 tripartite tricarboxylate transporter TctB family protein [Enterobacter sp. E76]MDA3133807.1 tripartite tricarboxylate transporter TctB family protein [Atlantibacter subterranea]RSB60272.1 tripartite tricarboxylate transporter TctB family protein [Atlantibacter subterranea]RSE02414.1 tripartite tricarboxylate transporter TctB family protein [Atlantibacter subterranea]RSE22925.1 tripartite tricarb
MRKQNIVVGAVAVIFGLGIIMLSRDMPLFDESGMLGERFWPFCLAWLFIGLGVLQLINVYQQRAAADTSVDLSSAPVRKAYWVAGLMGVYAIALCYGGFIASSLVLIPIVMRIMGEKRPWFLGVSSVLIVACIYIAFTMIFNSPLPESMFSE